MYGALLSSFRN
jgi:hypothetical protein